MAQQKNPGGGLNPSQMETRVCPETTHFLSLNFLLCQNQRQRITLPACLPEDPQSNLAGESRGLPPGAQRALQAIQLFGSCRSLRPNPFLTSSISELVFSSEQKQKSLEFFIRDSPHLYLPNPIPGSLQFIICIFPLSPMSCFPNPVAHVGGKLGPPTRCSNWPSPAHMWGKGALRA